MIIILDKKKMIVTREGETIRIAHSSTKFDRVPIYLIKQMIVIGNPMIAAGVLRLLAERNVSVIFLSERYGKSMAYMGSGLSNTIDIRIAQHITWNNPIYRVSVCRWLLNQKIKGQKQNLLNMQKDEQILNNPIKQLDKCLVEIDNEKGVFQLMGHEGLAARVYFSTLKNLLPEKWKFEGRNRRPPKDPVNALLSYTYTIAGGHIMQALQKEGLDPALGFLHVNQPNRSSLMLDILEPLRPYLDRFVFQLIDDVLNVNHFSTNEKTGCKLTKSGRKIFFWDWSDYIESSNDGLKVKIKWVMDAIKKLLKTD